jgi:hypothetical protein
MRTVTVKMTIGDNLSVESWMEGHQGWSRDEQGKFSAAMMGLLEQILAGKVK